MIFTFETLILLLYYENLFSQPGTYSLYDWSWNALSKQDVDGGLSLVSASNRLITVSCCCPVRSKMFDMPLMLIETKKVSADDFPIDLLKCIFSNHEWSESKSRLSKYLIAGDDQSPEWKKQIKVSLPSSF